MIEKQCTKCEETKNISEFYKDKTQNKTTYATDRDHFIYLKTRRLQKKGMKHTRNFLGKLPQYTTPNIGKCVSLKEAGKLSFVDKKTNLFMKPSVCERRLRYVIKLTKKKIDTYLYNRRKNPRIPFVKDYLNIPDDIMKEYLLNCYETVINEEKKEIIKMLQQSLKEQQNELQNCAKVTKSSTPFPVSHPERSNNVQRTFKEARQ